jgi:threonine/homoserine efflux transporter RhtA
LSWIQWAAIGSIMAASAGSAATSRPRPPIIAQLPD